MLIQTSRGVRQAAILCSDQRARGDTRLTDKRQQTGGREGGSQISQTAKTAGRRSSKTAGTIRKGREDPGNHRWKEQWPEKTGGDPGLADGDGRGG